MPVPTVSFGTAAVPMVRAAVGRKLHLFAHFHDLSRGDLVQEATIALDKALTSFKPRVGSLSTFVGRVCHNTLVDIWRQRSREAKRQAVYAEATWGQAVRFQHSDDGTARLDVVDSASPVESAIASENESSRVAWLGRLYGLVKETVPGAKKMIRHKGHYYRVAQVVAVGLLMHREKLLSASDCRALFDGSPALCRAIHFARPGQSEHLVRVPGDRWFAEAWIVGAKLLEQPGAREALAALQPCRRPSEGWPGE